jgi:endoglucanase
MEKSLRIFCLLFTVSGLNTYATKLINVQVVDKQYIMIYFKDGEVFYKDDAKGKSAYTGHDYTEGDDRLEVYGEGLNTGISVKPGSWNISSLNDDYYKKEMKPLRVFRKSKANNVANSWLYKSDHWIFLELPSPLEEGSTYKITIAGATNSDKPDISFTYDIFNSLSEAVHVNTIGYTPNSPIKQADLYYWLGDGGSRDYNGFIDNGVWLYNVETKEKHKVGSVKFWKGNVAEALGRSFTGSPVWNADIKDFNKPGKYRLAIEGVGCSQDFEIKNDLYFLPFKTSVRGYYYMRIGEDRMDMVPVPRRPLFIEGKDPIDTFKIYITDLDPWDEEWKEKSGDQWDEPHWKPFDKSMFWNRRVAGHPTNPKAYGGHSDALDWDRHLAHVSDIYDMLLPYFLSKGKINDDNLNIGESGNGIPDIIDEARNEVDFFLRLRYKGGYSQGLTNPDNKQFMMFQAGNTTMAAWANAANAAMLSDCFRISGNKKLMETYRDSSIVAFNYAEKQKDKMEGILQEMGNAQMTVHDFKMMAAAFLYNITGDTKWEKIMENECVITNFDTPVEKANSYYQIWGCAAYIFSPQKQNNQNLLRNMKAAMLHQAQLESLSEMKNRPSRRSAKACWWQTAENLHTVIISHAFADNEKDKRILEEALLSEYEWGLGRNPTNMVEMTGLGNRPVVNIYTSGRNDGVPGLHPGHTPYNNLGTWDTNNQGGSDPQWFVKRCYPDWSGKGWPFQEAYFNCRYSWSNGEFTPRETMRGKMALYGYIYSIQDNFKEQTVVTK